MTREPCLKVLGDSVQDQRKKIENIYSFQLFIAFNPFMDRASAHGLLPNQEHCFLNLLFYYVWYSWNLFFLKGYLTGPPSHRQNANFWLSFCSWILAEAFRKSLKHTNHLTLSAIQYHDRFPEPKQLGKFGGKFMKELADRNIIKLARILGDFWLYSVYFL